MQSARSEDNSSKYAQDSNNVNNSESDRGLYGFYSGLKDFGKSLGKKALRTGLVSLVGLTAYFSGILPMGKAYALPSPPAGLTTINAQLMDKATFDSKYPNPNDAPAYTYFDDPANPYRDAQGNLINTPLDTALEDFKALTQANPDTYLIDFHISDNRRYFSHRDLHDLNYDMEIYGDGKDYTIIEVSLQALKFLGIRDISGGTGTTGIGFVVYPLDSSGYMVNSHSEETINIDQSANIEIINNILTNRSTDATIIVSGPLAKSGIVNSILNYNDISATLGFQLQRAAVVDMGTSGKFGNNNVNCTTAIYGSPTFNGEVIAVGDAWVGTVAKSIKGSTRMEKTQGYLTNVNDIFAQKVDNDGGGTITISSPLGYNPVVVDTDNEGLTDGFEATIGTNPTLADTDGDHISDYAEHTLGSNPLNPADVPLISPDVWVDFAYPYTDGIGTSNNPFPTALEGIISVFPFGTVKIKGNTGDNSTAEALRITKPMRIEAVNGGVRIGANN
ncbi:hypothetical protein HYW74_02730 [Candidatus Pacearchaeota archaeon]|nr:hypothetical protein [Candidatus Pacearchaeota archaeon]